MSETKLNYELIYLDRFQKVDLAAKEKVWAIISKYIWLKVGKPESILDPAAGLMEFLKFVPAKLKIAIDQVRPASSDYKDHGITFYHENAFNISVQERVDCVFISNFLEHLSSPEDVHQILQRMHSLLNDKGVIVIMGPNFKYCYKEYFDCADHRIALTHVSVREHLHSCGFMVKESIGRFLPYSFRSRLPTWPFLVWTYLRIPLLWPLFGKQFFIIAEKSSLQPDNSGLVKSRQQDV